jgi:hypothetical protein
VAVPQGSSRLVPQIDGSTHLTTILICGLVMQVDMFQGQVTGIVEQKETVQIAGNGEAWDGL